MKIFLLPMVFLLLDFSAKAQEAIEISYTSGKLLPGKSLYNVDKKRIEKDLSWFYIIRKDTSLFFMGNQREVKSRNRDNGYGKIPIHHATYYFSNENLKFGTVNFKDKYFIVSALKNDAQQFIWMDTTTTILGYNCQAAVAINASGDSATMWIAKDLLHNQETYFGDYAIPGVVMEFLNIKNGTYYQATKIEKTSNKIYVAADMPRLPIEEYYKQKGIDLKAEEMP